jgi:hypothetical protein
MRTFHIILAFCAGLFTGYLLFDNDPGTHVSKVKSEHNAIISAQRVDAIKVNTDSALRKRNYLLAGQLLIVNSQLKESHATLITERKKIKAIQLQLLNDTSKCVDSVLQQNLSSQIDTLNRSTDTLICNYESKIRLAEGSIAVRDSLLIVCDRAYQDVQGLVQEQAARERQLTDDLNTVLKQQRKKRIQNKVLAVGMLFVAGFTTSLIIKSKQ